MRGCFVSATDTGVGKTVLAAAIAAALAADGSRVAAYKPVVTGVDEPEPGVAPDHELLARVTGQEPAAVAPRRFGPPVSPHLAAQLAGDVLDRDELVVGAFDAAARADAELLVVEGVGGLMVPLTDDWLVLDFAGALGLPIVLAARPGLGTISHTLLSLRAARTAGLDVRAVVLTPWPRRPNAIERSNRETIAGLGEIDVEALPTIAPLSAAALAHAGSALRPERWLGSAATRPSLAGARP
jgi:dethiobiotin synthetase